MIEAISLTRASIHTICYKDVHNLFREKSIADSRILEVVEGSSWMVVQGLADEISVY
jgi:hypothetical protein